MSNSYTNRRRITRWLVAVMVLAQFAALAALPKPAAAATSADPAEEIVFIDDAGIIRVIDTTGDPRVEWFSPSDGWTMATLGDFNNDGDLEIAALAEDPDIVRVGVFDPVVRRGATDPDKKINGIPWDTLHETSFPGVPTYIIAGNFDPNVPGDELAIGFRDGDENHYLRIWKAAGLDNQGNPTGRDWTVHIAQDWADMEDQKYATGDAGQVDGDGADELVLIDEDSETTTIDVFRTDDGFQHIDNRGTDTDRWRQAYIGQFIEGDGEEVAARLSVDRVDKRSIIVHEWDGSQLDTDDDWQWAFAPQAEDIFGADLFGNGDLELFILRKHQNREGIRLIMRDDWGDDRDRVEIEIDLDVGDDDDEEYQDFADEEFEKGEAGDLDGDGKDEIVLLRDDLIRIFTRPEDRIEDDSYIVDYEVDTTEMKPLIGDLDAQGFVEGPSFAVDKSAINAAVPIGTMSEFFTLEVTNNTTSDQIQFGATTPPGINWVQVSPAVATTPATLNIRFDATNLPMGTYRTELTLQSGQDVLNQPFIIDLELEVLPATILPMSPAVGMTVEACSTITDSTNFEPMTTTLQIRGTNDLNYRAAVISIPSEANTASASSASLDAQSGPFTGGEIDDNGDLVLYDASGNRRTIPMGNVPNDDGPPGEISTSAVLSTSWPIDPEANWITSVSSNVAEVPSTVTITADPSVLDPNFPMQEAMLVMVADTRAGSPPDNIYGVPIVLMCANNAMSIPSLY